jgi:hypothetical protein
MQAVESNNLSICIDLNKEKLRFLSFPNIRPVAAGIFYTAAER